MRRRDATRLSKKTSKRSPDIVQGLCSDYASRMATYPPTTVAVIFVSQRLSSDPAGYVQAADAMAGLAALQPGYLGMNATRDGDGMGITVSYWDSDAAAKAWRDHPDHAAIREGGRDRWYAWYDLHVAAVSRSYDWAKSK